MEADIIISNGQCITMTDKREVSWIAIKEQRIIGLGSAEGYLEFQSPQTQMIDAKGASVLPSFIDSHFHLVQTALNEGFLDLSSARSFDDIETIIRAYREENPGKGIYCVRLDVNRLKEGRYPNRKDLDRMSNEEAIWINCYDYQVSMLNTYGMLFFKIPYRLDGAKQDHNGVPLGIFVGKANAALRTSILDYYPNEGRRDRVSKLMMNLFRNGITTVNSMEGGYMYSDSDAEFVFQNAKDFPLNIALFYQSFDLDRIKGMKLKRVGGSFYLDGTIGARTAAISQDYKDSPGNRGGLFFQQEELNEFVESCYRNELQLSLYTIGDRAIDQALEAHKRAIESTGRKDLRHRLEHVILPREDQLERAADLGLIFSMSPTYQRYWGGKGNMYEQRLGEGYRKTNPLRKIIDAGIMVCGGSDSDVCEYNPFFGIHAAVNHPVEENRIELMEVLEMYTKNAAYAIFEEDNIGSLEVGKSADLIVLDRDILTCPKLDLEKVKVMATIKSGVTYHNIL